MISSEGCSVAKGRTLVLRPQGPPQLTPRGFLFRRRSNSAQTQQTKRGLPVPIVAAAVDSERPGQTTNEDGFDWAGAFSSAESVCLATALGMTLFAAMAQYQNSLGKDHIAKVSLAKPSGTWRPTQWSSVADIPRSVLASAPGWEQLAIWQSFPLILAIFFGVLLRRARKYAPFPLSFVPETLRTTSATQLGYRLNAVEKSIPQTTSNIRRLSDEVSKLRIKMRLLSRDLKPAIEALAGEHAQGRDIVSGLAAQLESAENRMTDIEGVLFGMQEVSMKQFRVTVQAIKGLEKRYPGKEADIAPGAGVASMPGPQNSGLMPRDDAKLVEGDPEVLAAKKAVSVDCVDDDSGGGVEPHNRPVDPERSQGHTGTAVASEKDDGNPLLSESVVSRIVQAAQMLVECLDQDLEGASPERPADINEQKTCPSLTAELEMESRPTVVDGSRKGDVAIANALQAVQRAMALIQSLDVAAIQASLHSSDGPNVQRKSSSANIDIVDTSGLAGMPDSSPGNTGQGQQPQTSDGSSHQNAVEQHVAEKKSSISSTESGKEMEEAVQIPLSERVSATHGVNAAAAGAPLKSTRNIPVVPDSKGQGTAEDFEDHQSKEEKDVRVQVIDASSLPEFETTDLEKMEITSFPEQTSDLGSRAGDAGSSSHLGASKNKESSSEWIIPARSPKGGNAAAAGQGTVLESPPSTSESTGTSDFDGIEPVSAAAGFQSGVTRMGGGPCGEEGRLEWSTDPDLIETGVASISGSTIPWNEKVAVGGRLQRSRSDIFNYAAAPWEEFFQYCQEMMEQLVKAVEGITSRNIAFSHLDCIWGEKRGFRNSSQTDQPDLQSTGESLKGSVFPEIVEGGNHVRD